MPKVTKDKPLYSMDTPKHIHSYANDDDKTC
jgi:hypothetical protein